MVSRDLDAASAAFKQAFNGASLGGRKVLETRRGSFYDTRSIEENKNKRDASYARHRATNPDRDSVTLNQMDKKSAQQKRIDDYTKQEMARLRGGSPKRPGM